MFLSTIEVFFKQIPMASARDAWDRVHTDSEDEADESGNESGDREKGSPEPAPHSTGGLLGSLKHLGSPSSGEIFKLDP